MVRTIRGFGFLVLLCAAFAPAPSAIGKPTPGQTAPYFSPKDFQEKTQDIAQLQNRSVVILYFFDPDSQASTEGLASLITLVDRYRELEVTVWAVTASNPERVKAMPSSTSIPFPLLFDQPGILASYGADVILPTICVLGPGLKILDVLQGAGKTTEMRLERILTGALHEKQPTVAEPINGITIDEPQQIASIPDLSTPARSFADFKAYYLAGNEPPTELKEADSLTADHFYFFTFRPERSLYLYMAQIDSRGSIHPIFPNKRYSAAQNPLKPTREYRFPEVDFFGVDQNAGRENILAIASEVPVESLEKLFSHLRAAGNGGAEPVAQQFQSIFSRQDSDRVKRLSFLHK
ncbi:MAG: DUF4384 domain-containing protein [Deltaproteobacteria bacterium]|nr:DUF4384 domain-containing protein [Deltaproteobacteria bacterium]